MQAVVACIANALGVDRPEASTTKPRSIPEAVQSFANTAQTLADAFGDLADLFERVSEPVQIASAPEPVQIEQSKPQTIEQASEPAPETMTVPADAIEPDPFCEKMDRVTRRLGEDAIAEEREESNENMSSEEPDFLPDGDPVNRMAGYDTQPSSNGSGRATKGRKRKGG